MLGHRGQAVASRRRLPEDHGTTFCGAGARPRHALGDIAATWTRATCANREHAQTRNKRKPATRGISGQRLPVFVSGFRNAHCAPESAAVDGADICSCPGCRIQAEARRSWRRGIGFVLSPGPGSFRRRELGSFCHRDWVCSAVWNWGPPEMRCARPVFNRLQEIRGSAPVEAMRRRLQRPGWPVWLGGGFAPRKLGSFRSTGSAVARTSSLRIAGGGPGARWLDRFGGRGARWVSRLTVARGGRVLRRDAREWCVMRVFPLGLLL
jgi:hypothetical protein